MIKVFFIIEEFELWNLILSSHSLYSPPDHLFEYFRKSYNDFRLLDALKALTLMKSFSEKNFTMLHHCLRVLYSPAETMTSHIASLSLLRDLCGDLSRGGRRVNMQIISQVFAKTKQSLIATVSDSHLSVFESYQPFIINSLDDIEIRLRSCV